jgi:ribonuclease E
MANKVMLIDATHPEETRVAVADGRKLEEFDVEIAGRRPLKGNIYLAKVTRVEPSLQAAFVEYGGNRHGFLAFSEIHPDYYRIPVADREALLRSAREDEDVEGPDETPTSRDEDSEDEVSLADAPAASSDVEQGSDQDGQPWSEVAEIEHEDVTRADIVDRLTETAEEPAVGTPAPLDGQPREPAASDDLVSPWEGGTGALALDTPRIELRGDRVVDVRDEPGAENTSNVTLAGATVAGPEVGATGDVTGDSDLPLPGGAELVEVAPPEEVVDTVGGEEPAAQDDPELDEERARRRRQRNLRRYKIQEVIKRRQILLVQVTKEERGNKGAALTTYLSLAGRYCVLMPNTDRGGGISRRITSANDRKRLKSIIDDLDVPEGMAVIVRTAGMERNKAEIGRDFEYLLRLWDEIRETTLQSTAPALIYEEASLIAFDQDSHAHRRHHRRRDGGLHGRARLHAHADAGAPETHPALSRPVGAAVPALPDRGPDRSDPRAGRAAAFRRLHRDQSDRGARRDRREFRPLHARAEHRGDGTSHKPRGGGRNRQTIAAARPRRSHRHRFH